MESLRSRGQVVSSVFGAILLLAGLACLADGALLRYALEVAEGGVADDARADAIDSLLSEIRLVQFGLTCLCAVVFLIWFHRAYGNLAAGGLEGMRTTPGRAVGWFFVPVLNLVAPAQAMEEIWRGSACLARQGNPSRWRSEPLGALVGWWWALFLGKNVIGTVAGQMVAGAEALEDILTAGWVELAADLLTVPAALVALLLVRRVTAFQEAALPASTGGVGAT